MRELKHSIIHSTATITILITAGKMLGFIRQALIAALFGATAETDAFFFAYNMPYMFFPAIGNSFALAFTSLYVSRIVADGEINADRYASRMLNATVLIGVLLGIAGIWLSPTIVPVIAPGFEGEQLVLAVRLTRFTMGAFVLIVMQYMLSAILNSKKIFISAQVAALMYNTVIIAITALLGKGQSMDVLTFTVIAGLVFQVATLAFFCRGHFSYTLKQSPFHAESKELLWFALPILLGNCVVQINDLVDKALGTTLEYGALSALSYSGSLNTLVISIFVLSLSTVLYPTLTSDAANGNTASLNEHLTSSIAGLSIILVPISCVTALFATDIVTIVYARGRFDQAAVKLTSIALACYAPYYVFSGIREVLTRGFFAIKNTKTPMINTAVGVAVNILVSIILVRYIGIAGIAIGTTVSALTIAVLLGVSAIKHIPGLSFKSVYASFGKQAVAGAVMIGSLLLFLRFVSLTSAILRFTASTVLGFAVYLAVLMLLKDKYAMSVVSMVWNTIRKYLRRAH